jgi:hypothetical protein
MTRGDRPVPEFQLRNEARHQGVKKSGQQGARSCGISQDLFFGQCTDLDYLHVRKAKTATKNNGTMIAYIEPSDMKEETLIRGGPRGAFFSTLRAL